MVENPLSQIADVTIKIIEDNSDQKIKYIISSIMAVIATISKIFGLEVFESSTVTLLLLLFIFDFSTGMWRSLLPKKNVDACLSCGKKCHTISSEIALRGVVKGIIYIIVCVIGMKLLNLKEPGILDLVTNLTGAAVISLAIITEIVSILENLSCISVITGVDIPLIDKLIKIMKKKEEDLIDNITNEDESKSEEDEQDKK